MSDFKNPKRFWSKVDVGEVDMCWPWLACVEGSNYGAFKIHSRMWRAHRVAWVLTYGPIPEGLCVLHKCDNPGCCNPYHLFLGTRSDNLADAACKGRVARGTQNASSKLTEEEVLEIRDLYTTGEWTQMELAEEFGVSQQQISNIVSRKTWGWLQ